MFQVTETLALPDTELDWKFARSGGPGGQNVNKVASKAILIWHLERSTLPADVKARLIAQQKRFVTTEGYLIITSQRHRDQDRNRQDCLEKLHAMVLQALVVPKARKKTRPSRGSKLRRLKAKRRRADVKKARQVPRGE